MTRICRRCNIEQDILEFTKNNRYPDGRERICKTCLHIANSEYRKLYYINNKEKIKNTRVEYTKNNIERVKAITTLSQHKNERGFSVHVSTDYIEQLFKEAVICPICGCTLHKTQGTKYGINTSPSLDIIDASRYIRDDNTWIVCHKCNTAKGNMSIREFVNYCGMIYEKFKDTGVADLEESS